MVTKNKGVLMKKLTVNIQEQLIANGIINFIVDDGTIRFMNIAEKAKGEEILRDYLFKTFAGTVCDAELY